MGNAIGSHGMEVPGEWRRVEERWGGEGERGRMVVGVSLGSSGGFGVEGLGGGGGG